jgi:hypothetical protein
MSPQPTCRALPSAAALAIAALLAAPVASAQVRVVIEGGVVVIGGEEDAAAGRPAGQPAGADEEFAIGDPWWDDVGGEPAAVGAEPPSDTPDRGRGQAQARLMAVRRSRGTQILRRELSRVRSACPDLGEAARAAILAAGREAVVGQAAGRVPLVGGLEAALESSLRNQAGTAAAAAYRGELEASAARRKQAALAVLIEVIDRDTVLDGEARRRLADTLRQAWRPDWEAVATTSARRPRGGQPSLPAGVADAVATALDVEAFTAWKRRAEEEVR